MMEKNTNTFTMFLADCTGNAKNSTYRNRVTISSAEDLAAACRKDHVCVAFANCHRSNGDYIRGYALAADCDNDFTEDPAEWITPETVAAQLPGVAFYAVKSRNCDKVKHPGEPGEKSARPRYHYYFPARVPVEGYENARKLADMFLATFPMFDDEGTKPAQFFYGHAEPVAVYYPGEMDITEYFHEHPVELEPEPEVDVSTDPVATATYTDDFATLNVDDMLSKISAACDHGTWYKVGMAIKAAGLPFEIWDGWSRTAPDLYPGTVKARKKWLSFKGGRITFGTLVHIAKQNGWTTDPDKLTGEAKRNHERKVYREEQQRKYREAHREEHAAKLAAIGIDCAGDPYRFTWKYDFDGSITEVIEKESGEIMYTKPAPEPDNTTIPGKTVHTVPAAAPVADPAAPWEQIVKGDALPLFPLERFPGWIKEYIDNFAANTGISKDFCAACIFGAVSSVVCGKLDIHFNTTHYEPAQLYTVFVGRSGMMKSSAIKEFVGPARTWLYEQNKSVKAFNQGIDDEITKLNNGYFKAQKKNQGEEVLTELKAQIDRKKNERKIEYPVPFSDVTPESLVRAIINTNGTATIATAEGNIINVLTGRSYTQRGAAPNLDIFLNGHDAEPFHSFRVTTGEVELKRVDISLLLAIQPALLETLCRSQDANGRGLVQRFLIFAPEESNETIDHTKPDTTDRRYSSRWNEHIRTIADRFMNPNQPPYIMELDLMADRIIRECWNYESELSRERGTDEEGIAGWISKLHGSALRLAAIFALLENPDATYITDADAEKSVTLLKEYFIPHYIGSFETTINMSNEQKAVATWIIRHAQRTGNRDSFTEHEAYVDLRQRSAFTGKAGQTNFRAALEDLQTKNYIRPLPTDKTASGRGRPAKSWQINPEIYTIKIPK